jgi:hypothetical protein
VGWTHAGDLFTSLIHTCQLCGANSFEYLIELQRQTVELSRPGRGAGLI